MTNIIIIAAAVIIVGGLIGGLVLIALAAGPNGPGRFPVSKPEGDLARYFERDASWAATTTVALPASSAALWDAIATKPYLSAFPFVTGPVTDANGARITRLTIGAIEEQVVAQSPESELVTVGTGISVPLALNSYAQRITLVDNGSERTVAWTLAMTPKWVGFLPLRWTAVFVRPFMGILLKFSLRKVGK